MIINSRHRISSWQVVYFLRKVYNKNKIPIPFRKSTTFDIYMFSCIYNEYSIQTLVLICHSKNVLTYYQELKPKVSKRQVVYFLRKVYNKNKIPIPFRKSTTFDTLLIILNGTYLWSFVTQIFRNGKLSHVGGQQYKMHRFCLCFYDFSNRFLKYLFATFQQYLHTNYISLN
jgi:hypothetical protein